jgi:hypothetical protein
VTGPFRSSAYGSRAGQRFAVASALHITTISDAPPHDLTVTAARDDVLSVLRLRRSPWPPTCAG